MFVPHAKGCCCVSQYILNYTRIFFFLDVLISIALRWQAGTHIFLLLCPSFYITHEAFWHNLNMGRSWLSRFGAGFVIRELKALLYWFKIFLGVAAGSRNVFLFTCHLSAISRSILKGNI